MVVECYLERVADVSEAVEQRGEAVVAVRGVLLQPVHRADVRHRREQVVLQQMLSQC